MSAIIPPKLSQIQRMRETLKGCSDYRVKLDWDTAVLDSTTAFLIWDDEHELLYAIQENLLKSMYEQPFRICIASYDQIEDIIANYS